MSGASQSKVKKSSEISSISKLYLFLYNAAQTCGWSYLLFQFVNHYMKGGDTETLWETVKYSVIVFQNAALLEILHVALGLVRSNLSITTMQVLSRVGVVTGLWMVAPPSRVTMGLPLTLMAWSVTEIIRYTMYALSIAGSVPYLLTWIRYTFFYVLYPVGVTGELLCYYATQQFAGRTKLFSYELPNAWNFTFSYQYALIGIMVSYIPLFPVMYHHMIVQRKKVIGGGSIKDTAKKAE